MEDSKLIWKVLVDTHKVKYECAQCDWTREYPHPFVHSQKGTTLTLSAHEKTHKPLPRVSSASEDNGARGRKKWFSRSK